MKQNFNICGEIFTTQKQLLDRCRKILYSVPVGSPLSQANSKFMCGVLAMHKSYVKKNGSGIDHIGVMDDGWKKRCFEVIRSDGTSTDFSFIDAVKNYSDEKTVFRAMRNAIVPSIIIFKQQQFDGRPYIKCPISGENVTYHACHVDHASPWKFIKIAREWFTNIKLSPSQIKLVGRGDGETLIEFEDRDLANKWIDFHNKYAILRIVSIKANLSTLQRKENL